jgi:glycosyltransferase involved in cell wall biosynthesis
MKKLVIVSTKPDGGVGGGIPSALIGYMNGFDAQGVSYQVIESHAEDRGVLTTWFFAFWKILLISTKHRGQVVFWFHCGPWLSIIRKFSLALIPRLLGNKTVIHVHSPTFYDYLSKSLITKLFIKLSLLPFKEVVVLTTWWKELLLKHGIDKNITISPNPNSTRYCEVAKYYSNLPLKKIEEKKRINILTMARLIEGKGVDIVIKALTLLPEEYTLTIAGDGPLKEELEQQAEKLGVFERINFTGWIDGNQKELLLTAADIFCLPSRYDSFGMVFIEAMAFNTPVVAYGWGPIQDVVTKDVGLCCIKPNAQEISCNIKKVSTRLEHYQGLGPKRVLKNYTPTVVVANIIKLLK